MRGQISTAEFGLYLSGVDLQDLGNELNRAGFPDKSICIVLPATHPACETLRALKAGTLTPDSAWQAEQTLNWLAKFGAVVIPDAGLFAAGPEFVGVMFESGIQKRNCSSVLHSLGVPWRDAERYQQWVKANGEIVFVCCDDAAHGLLAREILEEAGAEEVCGLSKPDISGEASFPAYSHTC